MASTFAFIALFLWIPFTFILVRTLPPTKACTFAILGTLLLLPMGVALDVPLMPPLDKERLVFLVLLFSLATRYGARMMASRLGRGVDVFIVILIFVMFGSVLTNRDILYYGPIERSAMSIKDGFSLTVSTILDFGAPFLIGRIFFRSPKALRGLLLAMVISALLYSVLILLELRLSPQFHKWLYGFHQHRFGGTIRFGGYRPMVFMASGIALSLFVAQSAIAATFFTKLRAKVWLLPARTIKFYLLVILILCKSVASALYGLSVALLISLTRERVQMRVAQALCIVVLLFPVMRSFHLLPVSPIVDLSAVFSVERAESLQFRFKNEDRLTRHALQRPLFGWGGMYGRNRVYNPVSGRDESITDGAWIIWLGAFGFPGMYCIFGLLLGPALIAAREFPRIPKRRDRMLVATTCLMLGIYAADLLPNGLFTTFPIFLSGALMGCLQGMKQSRRRRKRKASTGGENAEAVA